MKYKRIEHVNFGNNVQKNEETWDSQNYHVTVWLENVYGTHN